MKTNSHLHELQLICLGVMYGAGISHVHAWIHAGLGIRLALDIGAHKRRAYSTTPTVEDELYKRNFWMLVHLDRSLSSAMGRPCCVQEEDFDLDFPLCRDDQHIGHQDPRELPGQHESRPSYTGYFIWMLKLSQIHGLALRTLYASTKARAHYNFEGEDWVTRTTAHIDSLLNNWAESVPEHLRWDPKRADDLFFCQSAHLYLLYHELRIMVHRQSLAKLQPTPLSSPALTICMNAARSLVHLLSALLARAPNRAGLVRWDTAIAALVMLVGTGIARLNGWPDLDRKQTMADIDTMIAILRLQEDRWRCPGRYADALSAFKVLGDDYSPGALRQQKRRHEDDIVARLAPFPSEHTQDDAWREGLNSPSIFTSNTSSVVPDANDLLPVAGMPTGAGAFFGNINFGALFGFGNPDAHTQMPVEPCGDMAHSTESSQAGAGGMGAFGSDDWMGMSFDLGMDDWQWFTPASDSTELGRPGTAMDISGQSF
ncbi:unnamed protein product [Peniophora sp. CBMAI 1063]|nr:unnamed protein product [Peniophora sp. CBMAI 1063]